MRKTPVIMRALAAAVFAATLAACAAQPSVQRETSPALRSGNADQLAQAALRALRVERNPGGALTLITRAHQLAADRPELAWLHARVCIEARGCEPETIEARLRQLDPSNGAVWLGVLARAQARRDAHAEEQIIEAMSRSQRFDVYWTTLLRSLVAAQDVSATPRSDSSAEQRLTAALNEATDWLSGTAVTAFKPLGPACSQQNLRDSLSVSRCERIAQALQRSDTVLAEGMGLGIAQRLATPGSPAAARIAERIATLAYQNQTAGAVMRSQVEREKFSAELLELMKSARREQDVAMAILRWAGEPLTP